jgi:hypothetical protein
MGITANCAKFLFFARQQGASYANTLMLGRQQLYLGLADITALCQKFDFPEPETFDSKYAEPLFELLDAKNVDSVDYSDYESASKIHDLNEPFPSEFLRKYSVVFDGGTLEHIFNFPVALKSCMGAIAVGGHFISITPANNQCGHGFYQFSPELFFSVFSRKHGFEIINILLGVDHDGAGIRDWYEVANPELVRQRVVFINDDPAYLMVLAKKVEEFTGTIEPFQSDYLAVWDVHKAIKHGQPISGQPKYYHWYRQYVPGFIKSLVQIVRLLKPTSTKSADQERRLYGQFFRRIEI